MTSKLAYLTLLTFALCGVAPSAQPPQPSKTSDLRVTGLDAEQPFTVTATADATHLRVQLTLEDGWHMYGRESNMGPAVRLQILPGSSFAPRGPAQLPMNAEGQILGEATITQPLRRIAPGEALKVRFSYMVCDALQCEDPAEFLIERTPATARPLAVLLVTSDDQERSARIQAFLRQEGFTCKAIGYGAVTKAACEAHDLVVYDSPCSDQETWRSVSRAGRAHADAFPQVRTPIIAVGFLGTVLLEAHKMAIACGYI